MESKITFLFLILVFAGLASADPGTVNWAGSTSAPGAWETPSNWTSNPNLPTLSDLVKCYTSGGVGAQITINSVGVALAGKWQMKSGTTKLTVNSGATFTNSDGVEMFMGTTSQVDILATGVWNACTGAGGYFYLSTSTASKDTVNVWGTLNVDGTSSPTLTIGTTTNASGYGTMDIYGGGLVYADNYTIGSHGVINMWSGATMRIKGNVAAQANADITAGKIAGQGITLYAVYEPDYNWTVIPEPATVVLLGLGVLLLRKHK